MTKLLTFLFLFTMNYAYSASNECNHSACENVGGVKTGACVRFISTCPKQIDCKSDADCRSSHTVVDGIKNIKAGKETKKKASSSTGK